MDRGLSFGTPATTATGYAKDRPAFTGRSLLKRAAFEQKR